MYSVKGVTAIPMEEDRARTVLTALASRNQVDRRASLLPAGEVHQGHSGETSAAESIDDAREDEIKTARVKFAEEDQIKVVSPLPDKTFAPFASEMDWRIAEWVIKDGIGHNSFNRLVSIPGVSC